MTLGEITKLLDGKILTEKQDSSLELSSAFSSDMMSHVLAYANNKSILITALNNPQVLRTADLMGIECIIFIGREEPDPSLVQLADNLEIIILHSPYSMYVTCGMLFSSGLKGTMTENV